MKNFKNLKIWQKGIEIAVLAFKFIESFPPKERFGLSSQITRAAVSISSNIAEGCSRSSEKDCKRFLEIALGSSYELETHLLIADSMQFGDLIVRQILLFNVIEEEKMLTSFLSRLNN